MNSKEQWVWRVIGLLIALVFFQYKGVDFLTNVIMSLAFVVLMEISIAFRRWLWAPSKARRTPKTATAPIPAAAPAPDDAIWTGEYDLHNPDTAGQILNINRFLLALLKIDQVWLLGSDDQVIWLDETPRRPTSRTRLQVMKTDRRYTSNTPIYRLVTIDGEEVMVLLPHRVDLVMQGRRYQVPWTSTAANVKMVQVIEDGEVPADALTQGYDWAQQAAVATYGAVELAFMENDQRMQVLLLVSDVLALGACLRALSGLAFGFVAPEEEPQPAGQAEPAADEASPSSEDLVMTEPAEHPLRRHFARLGLDMDSPPAEVSKAYRDLTKRYHPDKFAQMAPEFQAVAEHCMSEINEAYREVQRYQQASGSKPSGSVEQLGT